MPELYILNLASVGDRLSLCGEMLHNNTLPKFGQFLSEIHSVGEDALTDTVGANPKAGLEAQQWL